MCPMSHKRLCVEQHRGQRKQRGSMLVIALFIIIVLAILGLAMLRMLAASADSVVSEVYGQRALNAARAGVERSIAAAFPVVGASIAWPLIILPSPVPQAFLTADIKAVVPWSRL